MPLEYGTQMENGRNESYAQIEFSFQNKDYVIRVVALFPYKDYAAGSDELLCHIDFMNITDGISGRFSNVTLPERRQNEGTQRRHSAFRMMRQLIAQGASFDPSPVFP